MRAEAVADEAADPIADPEAVTRARTATTSAASSLPRMRRLGRNSPLNRRTTNGAAWRKPQSVRFTDAAKTRSSSSFGPGAGRGTSARRSTSGGP